MENKNKVTRSPETIAAEINGIKAQAGAVMASAFSFARRSVFEIGKRLEEAKCLLPHGEWGKWLERNVAYSESTANNIMRCYREFGDEQIDMLSGVSDAEFFGTLSQSQMVELFALPKAERREFVEEHREELESGEMSIRDMKEEIKRLKAENASQAEDIRFNDETYNQLLEEFKQQGEELAAMKATPAPEPVVQEVIVNQPSEEQINTVRDQVAEQLREEFEKERAQNLKECREEVAAMEKERDEAVEKAEKEAEDAGELAAKLEKIKADHKAELDKLRAEQDKKLAAMETEQAKKIKATAAGSDADVLRVQISLSAIQREVRAISSVLDALKNRGEEQKADKLQAQIENQMGVMLSNSGWTV